MVSLKDYARIKGISYEAVRKQVNRYKGELEGHISKINRAQYLDDVAVAFLDQKRQNNPVVLVSTDKDEEIQRLTDENKALLVKVTQLQEALLQEKDAVKALQAERIALLDDRQQEENSKAKSWFDRIFGR